MLMHQIPCHLRKLRVLTPLRCVRNEVELVPLACEDDTMPDPYIWPKRGLFDLLRIRVIQTSRL